MRKTIYVHPGYLDYSRKVETIEAHPKPWSDIPCEKFVHEDLLVEARREALREGQATMRERAEEVVRAFDKHGSKAALWLPGSIRKAIRALSAEEN